MISLSDVTLIVKMTTVATVLLLSMLNVICWYKAVLKSHLECYVLFLMGVKHWKKYFYTCTPSFTHSYLDHWKAGTIKTKYKLQKARWGRLLYCSKVFEDRAIKSIMLWQTCNITFIKWQDITMRNKHSSNTLGNV